MPLLPSIGRAVGTGIKAGRLLVRGSLRGGAWATRRVGTARARGAANEIGMIRLFDLHAISCAGDTLIAIGLAGTIFFSVPLGEARGKVALYLLITMVPFALLAPVVGPVLDHFRHGRRYALAVTMLGRVFLAYVISDHLFGWGLYPAAFGVLALSRAYGVARSAAVPRLLPEGIGLSQVGARASVYGTFAGAIVSPIGLLAFKFGPQWPLRVACIIFAAGVVVSLRLPPRADSDPPEAVPQPWRAMLRLGRGADRPLSGKLVVSTLLGSASLRLLYGFLLLFLTFVVMAHQLDTHLLGTDIGRKAAVGLIGGALAVGTFLSTAVGTRLRIRRPLALQSAGLTITAAAAVLAALFYSLPMVALLALVTAVFSGIAKLAIDASLQERVPERLRASAFGHSETVLMIAWVAGGGIGLIPLPGRMGVALGAALAVLAAVRAGFVATRLHNERLKGRSDDEPSSVAAETVPSRADRPAGRTPDGRTPGDRTAGDRAFADRTAGRPATGSAAGAPTGSAGRPPAGFPAGSGAGSPDGTPAGSRAASPVAEWPRSAPADPWPEAPTVPARNRPNPPAPRPAPADDHAADASGTRRPARPVDPTLVDPRPGRKGWFGRRREKAAPAGPPPAAAPPPSPPAEAREDAPTRRGPAPGDGVLAPPGYHVYRPSSASQPAAGSPHSEDDDA